MKLHAVSALAFFVALPVACSGTQGSGGGFGAGGSGPGETSGSSSGSGFGSGNGSGSGGSGSGGGSSGSFGTSDASAPSMNGCQYADSTDHDGDGFSSTDGDCNDCDPNTNPGAFDVPMDKVDEDCDGTADNEPSGCDTMAVLDSTDPYNAGLAMDLCRKTTETAMGKQRTWGIVGASYVAPDGSDTCTGQFGGGSGACSSNTNYPLGHGNLTKLGVNKPQQGSHMHAMSSGSARDPSDPGYQNVSGFDKGFTVGPAPGYPAAAPACPNVITGQPHDGMALRLTIRVPTNAQSFSFDSNFFTYEFPNYICSTYNDTFVAEMAPAPMGASKGGNVVFDTAGNPISVNNALLQVCDPQTAGGKMFTCPLGSSTLSGTGFGNDLSMDGNHAATGWLRTTVNVDPMLKGKDITLVFAVWDSGDGVLDSTALIDNFTWSTQPGSNTPVTKPTPPAQ